MQVNSWALVAVKVLEHIGCSESDNDIALVEP